MRRLPVYLLLDCSESMAGKAMTSMTVGVHSLLKDLRRDPAAMEMAYISVITFASRAKQLVPLTELYQFQLPKLVLGSGTSLGAAIDLLKQRIASEVVQSTTSQKGDYKPIVFIMTDGEPTDSWNSQADWLMRNRHFQTVVAGIGPDVNPQALLRLSETVIHAKDSGEENFSQFFKWVSSSVSTASQKVDASPDGKVDLRKFPETENMVIVDETTPAAPPIPNRFLFLHARCNRNGAFYLMKFVKEEKKGVFGKKIVYNGIESIPLDDFDFMPSDGQLSVSTNELGECTPCPYCGNTAWGMCECGKIFCMPPSFGRQTCPWCNTTGDYVGATFDVGRGAG